MAKIFVVEDDHLHAFLVQRILEKSGHEIHIIRDVLRFKEEINENQPDLIIMDLSLPHRSGMNLIQDLRQMTLEISEIPVVVVSAKSLTDIGVQLAELGCLGFVSKPFRSDKLRQVIDNVLQTITQKFPLSS